MSKLPPCSGCNPDERKAAGLSPFILTGAAVAVFGGAVGVSTKTRKAAGGIAALLFLAI